MAVADLPPKTPIRPQQKKERVRRRMHSNFRRTHSNFRRIHSFFAVYTLRRILFFLLLRFRIWRRRNAHFCEEERIRPAVYTLSGSTGDRRRGPPQCFLKERIRRLKKERIRPNPPYTFFFGPYTL